MHNRKIKIILCTFLITLILSSCRKFLDKKQNAAAVVPSGLNDLQALVDNGTFVTTITPSYEEVSSDEFFLTDDIFNSLTEIALQWYTRQPFVAPPNSANDWGTVYHAIYNANLILDLIKNVNRNPTNETQWDDIKGNALFFRAYHFLNLLWEYSNAYDSITANNDWGIALRLTSDFNAPSTRASNQQSYEQVINDAKSAIPLLPDYPQVLTRASKGAAYGLLARCYLSMRDYKNAFIYADSSLQINNHLIDFNNDADIAGSIVNDAPFKQYNKETVLYAEMNYDYDMFTQTGFIDTSILKLYAQNDLRQTAYYKDNGTGHFYFKAPYTGNSYVNFTGIATDEMYLIRSECYIRAGHIQKGLNDLTTLQSKRYETSTLTTLANLSQNDALTTVLQERRKELLFRGNRWMDIKRLNKEGMNIVLKRVVSGTSYTLLPNAGFYALPIPDDIIQITGMPQNKQ